MVQRKGWPDWHFVLWHESGESLSPVPPWASSSDVVWPYTVAHCGTQASRSGLYLPMGGSVGAVSRCISTRWDGPDWGKFALLLRRRCRLTVDLFIVQLWRRWFHRQVMPIQYGSRNRDQGLFGPISPEGEFTEEQLAENRQDIDNIMADPANEFIDDGFYDDRMTHDNLGNVEIPVLTAGNWVGLLQDPISSSDHADDSLSREVSTSTSEGTC